MRFSNPTPFKSQSSQRFITYSCSVIVHPRLPGSVNRDLFWRIAGRILLFTKFTQAQVQGTARFFFFFKGWLSQIAPNIIDNYDKRSSSCNLTHMFCSCRLFLCFWQNYFYTSINVSTFCHIWISRRLQLILTYNQIFFFHFLTGKSPPSSSLEAY